MRPPKPPPAAKRWLVRGEAACTAPGKARQFSSSHSPATLRTKVVLPSRHFSSSSSPLLRALLKLYYKVASSQLLPTHQFSSSHSPATLRTKVVLPSRHFSSSSSPATSRTTQVVLQSRPALISQLPRYSTPSSCTTRSPVLIFPLPSYSAYYSRTTTSPVLRFQLPSYSAY